MADKYIIKTIPSEVKCMFCEQVYNRETKTYYPAEPDKMYSHGICEQLACAMKLAHYATEGGTEKEFNECLEDILTKNGDGESR